MARVVIVGAGVTGREVAKRLDDPVVIESDVEKANMLKRELGDIRVVVGDATDERTLLQAGISEARSLLVCIGNDKDAYQTVLNSKPYKNLTNVIAVLQKPDDVPRFQRLGVQSIIIPDLATAGEVLSILKPSEKRISEIVITKGAEAIGQRLDDLVLPWGTSVIGIMRGDKLMAPTGDMALDTMDVVHVSADVEELNAVRGVFLGDHRQLLPFSKILVPIMDESWFETEFQEALSIAMFCQAGIIGMFPAEAPWLVKKAAETCQSMQVPFFSLPGYNIDFQAIDDATRAAAQVDIEALRKDSEQDIVNVLKNERTDSKHLHEHGEEEDVDLLVLRSETLRLVERVGKKPLCVQAAEETILPILVARQVEPYSSILFMLDGSPRSNNIASLALRIAIAFGSKVTALTAHDPEHEEAHQMLKHIKRTGEMYGLEIVEDEVEGNPTLEFVSLVKSGEHDLTLVNRACKTVKKDIIRRVYMSAPKSVMVI
jgi:Trk K+ transport system NAD-binding subunit/nucleotide-binding universal stress UspA family protein